MSNEMKCGQSMTPRTIGHYFEFKRGTWVVDANGEKKQHHSDSGLAYVGSLTEAGKLGLDELISEYVAKEGAKTREETEDVCAHRHYKTHCRICRIAKLESSLAEAVAALRSILGGPEIVDEKIGWLGQTASTINHYQCEFCRAENTDCTKIEHTSICPIPPIRAIVAKHSG